MATGLGKGKLWFQTNCTSLKKDWFFFCQILLMVERLGKYTLHLEIDLALHTAHGRGVCISAYISWLYIIPLLGIGLRTFHLCLGFFFFCYFYFFWLSKFVYSQILFLHFSNRNMKIVLYVYVCMWQLHKSMHMHMRQHQCTS